MTDITHATQVDLPDILDMIQSLSAYHGDTAQVTLPQLGTIFFGTAQMSTALIAKIGGNAVGYAGLTPLMVLHDGKIRLDIHHMFVRDSNRASGVGTALIRAAKAHALEIGATRLTISTDAGNTSAIAAYRAIDLLQEITDPGPRFRVDLTA